MDRGLAHAKLRRDLRLREPFLVQFATYHLTLRLTIAGDNFARPLADNQQGSCDLRPVGHTHFMTSPPWENRGRTRPGIKARAT